MNLPDEPLLHLVDGEHEDGIRRAQATGDALEIHDDTLKRRAIEHFTVKIGRGAKHLLVSAANRLHTRESGRRGSQVKHLGVGSEEGNKGLKIAPVVRLQL